MIQVREDRIGNFVEVLHKYSGEKYRVHVDDVPKLGTKEKLAAYAVDGTLYFAPNKEFPHGRYRSKVRFFIGEYLLVPVEAKAQIC